jgi:hypothetical protein
VIILLIKSRTVLYNKIDMVVQRIPLLGITIFKVAVIFEFWLLLFGVFLCVCCVCVCVRVFVLFACALLASGCKTITCNICRCPNRIDPSINRLQSLLLGYRL